jgi:hypothetical protein
MRSPASMPRESSSRSVCAAINGSPLSKQQGRTATRPVGTPSRICRAQPRPGRQRWVRLSHAYGSRDVLCTQTPDIAALELARWHVPRRWRRLLRARLAGSTSAGRPPIRFELRVYGQGMPAVVLARKGVRSDE